MDVYRGRPPSGGVYAARDPDRLVCRLSGPVDAGRLAAAADALVDCARENGGPAASAVEIDLRGGRMRYAYADLIAACERVLAEIRPLRVAVIGEPGETDTHLMVFETVTFPHGGRVRRFSRPEPAADWLRAPAPRAPR